MHTYCRDQWIGYTEGILGLGSSAECFPWFTDNIFSKESLLKQKRLFDRNWVLFCQFLSLTSVCDFLHFVHGALNKSEKYALHAGILRLLLALQLVFLPLPQRLSPSSEWLSNAYSTCTLYLRGPSLFDPQGQKVKPNVWFLESWKCSCHKIHFSCTGAWCYLAAYQLANHPLGGK